MAGTAGNGTIARRFAIGITPASPSAQGLVTSNGDGTYLLTFSSSMAANFLISLSVDSKQLATASTTVYPSEANAAHSQVWSAEFGRLEPETELILVAGRPYEFGVLLFDSFGNRASEPGREWVMQAVLTSGNGTSETVTAINQLQKRSGVFLSISIQSSCCLPPKDGL